MILLIFLTLPKEEQTNFLIMLSVFCWTLWKLRNELCFQSLQQFFFFELSSFSSYPRFIWTWAIKGLCRELILLWMPGDIEAIPLQVWDLEDSQIVLYQEPEERDDFSD